MYLMLQAFCEGYTEVCVLCLKLPLWKRAFVQDDFTGINYNSFLFVKKSSLITLSGEG